MIPRSPLIDYAEANYVLGMDSAISGAFRIENSPYLAAPAQALCDPLTREVTLQIAAQGGKNILAEIWYAYIIARAPANFLHYNITDDDAEDFAEKRLLKRIREMDSLRPLIPETGRANRKNEADFGFMYALFLGANPANFQGKSARYAHCDEAHQWKQGMLPQARDRVSAFWDGKIFITSTGGDEGSDVDLAWQHGTREEWHFGCPECGRLVKPRWSEQPRVLLWTADDVTKPKGKAWNFQEVRKTIRFKCPHDGCNCEMKDSFPMRVQMNLNGEYISENPNAPLDVRSFHCPKMCYPWVEWEKIVEDWILAIERKHTGDLSLLKNFVVKTLGETWENRVGGDTMREVVTGGYPGGRAFAWEKENQRAMTVDVQSRHGRHFWFVVRAWAIDGESRLVWAGRLNSWADVERARKEWVVLPNRVCVDARHETKECQDAAALYDFTWLMADEKVKDYAHKTPGVRGIILKPFSARNHVLSSNVRDPGNGRQKIAYGWHFSKEWVRQAIHNRIMGAGTKWELPDEVHEWKYEGTSNKETSYLEQLNSWVPFDSINPRTERRETGWKQIHRDDHLRACEEMQLIYASIQGIIPSEIGAREE
jgi:Phage terminase large subunit (GpA)